MATRSRPIHPALQHLHLFTLISQHFPQRTSPAPCLHSHHSLPSLEQEESGEKVALLFDLWGTSLEKRPSPLVEVPILGMSCLFHSPPVTLSSSLWDCCGPLVCVSTSSPAVTLEDVSRHGRDPCDVITLCLWPLPRKLLFCVSAPSPAPP